MPSRIHQSDTDPAGPQIGGSLAGRARSAAGWRSCLAVTTAVVLLAIFNSIVLPRPVRAGGAGTGAALISAEVSSTSPPVRSGAPITVVWKLKSQLTTIQEGQLEVVIRDDNEILARVRSDDMAIALGEQLYRMVLPPVDTHNPYGAVDMHLRLVGPKQTYDFGAFPLRVSTPWQRNFVVGVCDSWDASPSDAKPAFLQRFRFETYNPDDKDRTVTTNLTSLVPESLIPDPLLLCGYDVIVLVGRGVGELKVPQLDALASWVEAGGSLCVAPDGQPIKSQHLDFITRVCGHSSDAPLELDQKGRLVVSEATDATDSTDAPSKPIRQRRCGLGRAALVVRALESMDSEHASIRSMLAFLWKLRKDQTAHFVETGKWRDDAVLLPRQNSNQNSANPQVVFDADGRQVVLNEPYMTIRPREMKLAPIALQTGDQLISRLMPRDLKVVPLKLIGFVLFLYILVIGPLDYFVLGALRRRRWTWILFPAITIGFAWATIGISNWYMRFHDSRRSVTVFDLGEEGSVARGNRFETLFRAVPGEISTDVSRGLVTAMNHQKFGRGTWYAYQQASTRGTEDQLEMVAIPLYSGRVPAKYEVLQSLPQWTPQLNRLLKISADVELPAFDWSLPSRFSVVDSNVQIAMEARQSLGKAITEAIGKNALAFVVTGKHVQQVAGSIAILGPQDPQVVSTTAYTSYPNHFYNFQSETASFLQDICTAEALGGLFGVVSQVSPTGGKDFEDLALLDPSDTTQWMLVMAFEQGDDLVVCRKLYTGERE